MKENEINYHVEPPPCITVQDVHDDNGYFHEIVGQVGSILYLRVREDKAFSIRVMLPQL